MTDLRDHVRLSRTSVHPDDGDAWRAWEARTDAARASTQGPPHPADRALAEQLAAQERILFGAVRTRFA